MKTDPDLKEPPIKKKKTVVSKLKKSKTKSKSKGKKSSTDDELLRDSATVALDPSSKASPPARKESSALVKVNEEDPAAEATKEGVDTAPDE